MSETALYLLRLAARNRFLMLFGKTDAHVQDLCNRSFVRFVDGQDTPFPTSRFQITEAGRQYLEARP